MHLHLNEKKQSIDYGDVPKGRAECPALWTSFKKAIDTTMVGIHPTQGKDFSRRFVTLEFLKIGFSIRTAMKKAKKISLLFEIEKFTYSFAEASSFNRVPGTLLIQR